MTTLLSPKVFVLPLLALIVIASLPRQGENQAPTAVACAASLPSDAVTQRQTSKPVCEPGRGHLAQERANHTIQ